MSSNYIARGGGFVQNSFLLMQTGAADKTRGSMDISAGRRESAKCCSEMDSVR